MSSLRVTFNESINPDTFSLADIGSFTGPGNVAIAATDVTPVPNSSDRQFDITFAEQTVEGLYTMIIGPEIQDIAATPNSMDQDRDGDQAEATDDQYTANFTIDYFPGPDGFGYEAHPIAIEAIDLVAGAPASLAFSTAWTTAMPKSISARAPLPSTVWNTREPACLSARTV